MISIAWGRSRLLEFYLKWGDGQKKFDFIVDSNKKHWGTDFFGLEVKSPDVLIYRLKGQVEVTIFAASNIAIQEILMSLNRMGYKLGEDVHLYSDLLFDDFVNSMMEEFQYMPSGRDYLLVKAMTLVSQVPIYTTVFGNLLFLSLLDLAPNHSVAEVGSFYGGNAVIGLLWMEQRAKKLPFYIIDSFEGLKGTSSKDLKVFKEGDCSVDWPVEAIESLFSTFHNAKAIKGAVPNCFYQLNKSEKYGLVFYDCDLYQPAMDTFEYFWPRIVPGGYLMVHDYVAAKRGGTVGVKKAVDEFFGDSIKRHVFWQTTSVVIQK